GRSHRIDLVDGVLGAVDFDIETNVEEMLVVGGGQPGGDHVGVPAWPFIAHGHGGHDPAELHLQLHRSVEVEVPVEAVLVVPDRGNGAHHQAARAADLGTTRDHVHVLPEDSVVLLVHADGVRPSVGLA